MTTRSFHYRYCHLVEKVARQLTDDPELDLDHLTERYLKPGPDHKPNYDGQMRPLGDERLVFMHVTSKCHLNRRLLAREEPNEILAEQCLHYARVSNIALVSYSFIDSEFHLTVGLREESWPLDKMVGAIKQQFTNRFKGWYNIDYRKEKKGRPAILRNGTLWIGRPDYDVIEDEVQLAACMMILENQRLAADCGEQIDALEEPPRFVEPEREEASDEAGEPGAKAAAPCLLLQAPYEEILETLKGYRFQSTGWYLNGCKGGEATCLTDGTDGVWATDEEVKNYFHVAARKLPKGWRKVWFKERRGILKPTPTDERRYPGNPFVDLLGTTRPVRAARLGRLMMGQVFGRAGLLGGVDFTSSEEAGADNLS